MTMKRKHIWLFVLLSLVFAGIFTKVDAASPTYTVSPNSRPYDAKMTKFSTYNGYTKHYYLLRSYLERLEKTGGGTLILNKGTYTISNTLYVPSNVTIYLRDGVVLNKGKVTGTNQFGAAKSMFQLIRPSRANRVGVYGGYNGERNIRFIGQGTAIIDMKYLKDGIGIIAGHNQNVTIQGIQFRNMYSGHFLEVDATKNITITKNRFQNSYASENKIKEAINLDTPDKLTEGWSQKWSKFDKTANYNVTIQNNSFYNLDVAVGTHNYSEGKYHTNVVIRNNSINKMRTTGIWAMNWQNAVIEKNSIQNLPNGSYTGIRAYGVIRPVIQYNTFTNVPRAIQFMPWKNEGKAARYKTSYNSLTVANKRALETNTLKNGSEGFIRINKVYKDYSNNIEFIPLNVVSLKAGSNPFNPFEKKLFYASRSSAKSYKTASKTGGYYGVHQPAEQLELYYHQKDWYYGYVAYNGKQTKAYYHVDEIQANKPLIKETFYAKADGAKAYKTTSLSGGYHKVYTGGTELGLVAYNEEWYYLTNSINGVATKVYVHVSEIQTTKPLISQTLYVSNGGAKAYKTTSQTGDVIQEFEVGKTVKVYILDENWYYGYITYNDTRTKVYFHKTEVQTTQPKITYYAVSSGAKAYLSTSLTGDYQKVYAGSTPLGLYKHDAEWYYVTSASVVVYFHKDEIQTTKPTN